MNCRKAVRTQICCCTTLQNAITFYYFLASTFLLLTLYLCLQLKDSPLFAVCMPLILHANITTAFPMITTPVKLNPKLKIHLCAWLLHNNRFVSA